MGGERDYSCCRNLFEVVRNYAADCGSSFSVDGCYAGSKLLRGEKIARVQTFFFVDQDQAGSVTV